jgi:N-acetylglucosaminyldiphosphoundecaprenol N-acetyl-beta-D-mannosaminyltransferase
MTAQTVPAGQDTARTAEIPFGNMSLLGLRPATPPVRLQLAAVSPMTAPEATEAICNAAQAGRGYVVVNPNLAHMSLLRRDAAYRERYAQADLAIPDGWPVVRMMQLHGAKRAERLVGTDMLPQICDAASERGLAVGFIGGAGHSAVLAAEQVRRRHPGLAVTLADPAPPGFDRDDDSFAHWQANLPELWPDIIFVGLGEPKQTLVSLRLREDPRARVLMGVGKAVEFVAGTATRAPEWAVKHGLEWAHRAITEPRRLGPRYLRNAMDLPILVAGELRARRAN